MFDVMIFVDCAVYLYGGSLLSFSLLGKECKMSGFLRGIPVQLVLVVLGCAFLALGFRV